MCFLPVIEATTTASPTRLPVSSHNRHPIFQWLLLNGHPRAESHLGQSCRVGTAGCPGETPGKTRIEVCYRARFNSAAFTRPSSES